jgi:hypothetical protein
MMSIRDEFLQNQPNMMAILEDHKTYFENPDEYEKCKKYILGFFNILADPDKFKSEILDNRRDK